MGYIEAVGGYEIGENERSLFVAGGITGCVDWQLNFIRKLEEQVREWNNA